MAHVELSLSESFVSHSGPPVDDSVLSEPALSLNRWVDTAARANEPCLVINADGAIIAASIRCHMLLNMGAPGSVHGRHLLDGVIRLVDFTAARVPLTEAETDKIPPLLALSSGRLARGLMRVHDGVDFDATMDAIAAPLCDGAKVIGSITFLSPV